MKYFALFGVLPNTLAVAFVCVVLLSGCAELQPQITRAQNVADDVRESAEFTLCKGITVGAWVRAYGTIPEKAEAWRTLCNESAIETPAKK
jgi:hypothetical protein